MSSVSTFLDEKFLLRTKTAQELYNQYAAHLPIIDYHCHIPASEIAEDIRFDNITQLWLKDDHYKWRLMRAAGVEEHFITGDATDREKFDAWAKTLGRAVGNPLYHWSHMELARYFGFDGLLSEETADEVWKRTGKALQGKKMSAAQIIAQSNVELLCTTDDPADLLNWHQQIAGDPKSKIRVLPSFRADRALNIEQPEFFEFIGQMEEVCRMRILKLEDLYTALRMRMEHFAEMGCCLSDHGIDRFEFVPTSRDSANRIFRKRLSVMAGTLPEEEIKEFKAAMMLFLAKSSFELGWTMQVHIGARRDNNTAMYESIGPNTGYDCISGGDVIPSLSEFMNALEQAGTLPRMILYSLNPNDNALLCSLVACFQKGPQSGRVQSGAAWWFNDHEAGIRSQLQTLMNYGYLPSFLGMLTDSRSLLSYVRHDYFRRILCDVLGQTVEEGLFPPQMDLLGEIVTDIGYRNTKRLFGK